MDSALASTKPNPIPSAHHRKIELQSYADLTYLQQNLARSARAKLDLHFPPIPPTSSSSKPSAVPATFISLDGPASQSSDQHSADANNSTINTQRELQAAKYTEEQEEEEEEDPLRARVRHLIDAFLHETNSAAKHSISVNGIDASSLLAPSRKIPNCTDPEPIPDANGQTSANGGISTTTVQAIEGVHYTYEPFDPRLQKKLAALHGELETLTAQVSKLRRDAPGQVAASYARQLEEEMQRDDEEWEAEKTRMRLQRDDSGAHAHAHGGLDVPKLRGGWNQEVKGTFERGVGQLAVLSGVAVAAGAGDEHDRRRDVHVTGAIDGVSLTETVGRAQRARNVAMEFE